MRPYWAVLLLVLAACVPANQARPPYTGPVHGMILSPMSGYSSVEQGYAYLETAVFASSSFRTYFKLIDRGSLEVLLKENRLSAMALLQEGTAAPIGKQLGARYLLKTSLAYARTESYQSGTAKTGFKTYYRGTAETRVSLVDLESGQVFAAAVGQGSSSSSSSNYSDLTSRAIQGAIQSAIREVLRLYAQRVS